MGDFQDLGQLKEKLDGICCCCRVERASSRGEVCDSRRCSGKQVRSRHHAGPAWRRTRWLMLAGSPRARLTFPAFFSLTLFSMAQYTSRGEASTALTVPFRSRRPSLSPLDFNAMRNFVSDTLSQREMADLVRSVFNNPVELDLVIEEQAHDFTANPDSAPERARKSAFVVFWYIIKLTQGASLLILLHLSLLADHRFPSQGLDSFVAIRATSSTTCIPRCTRRYSPSSEWPRRRCRRRQSRQTGGGTVCDYEFYGRGRAKKDTSRTVGVEV